MTESRRSLLLLLAGLLLAAGLTVVAVEYSEPDVVAAEVPNLLVAPTTTTSTTELPTTTAVPEATTTTSNAPAPPPVTGGAVAPPRNAYAPEPIREIGRIRIPKIGLDHKVMEGISMRNIDQGPSHWPGTPMPGEAGNTVFMGHRTTHSRPFRPIDRLVPGDEIFFDIGGVQTRYVVTGHEIVTPNRLDIVDPTPTPTATLFACQPDPRATGMSSVPLSLPRSRTRWRPFRRRRRRKREKGEGKRRGSSGGPLRGDGASAGSLTLGWTVVACQSPPTPRPCRPASDRRRPDGRRPSPSNSSFSACSLPSWGALRLLRSPGPTIGEFESMSSRLPARSQARASQ